MQAAERNPIAIKWDFIGLFLVYLGVLVGVADISAGFLLAFREFTSSAIAALGNLFPVTIVSSGTRLTFGGFPMEIVLECTALHYMIIFLAGVLAFRSHRLSYRVFGVVAGIVAIFLLNLTRIGIVGFVGRYYSDLFAFIHEYLWEGMFALSVVLLWILWVNGKRIFSRKLVTLLLRVFFSASLSFWLMVTFLDSYVSLLASLYNAVLPVLSLLIELPQRIISDGKLIGYVIGNEVTYSKTTLYFLNAALLMPIASITFVRSQKKIFLKRLCAAALLLVAQHMLVITLDWLLEVASGAGIQSVIVWCIVMTTFIAPMLIWLAVMNIFPAPREQRDGSEKS